MSPNIEPVHIQILRDQFETRTQRNSNYSLRAFARDLEISPGALSNVLQLKKGLSEKKAQELSRRLGLSVRERERFLLSARAFHARSRKTRELAQEKILKRFEIQKKTAKLELPPESAMQNWYDLALMELLEIDGCTHKPEWFAQKLGLNVLVVRNALKRLVQSGDLLETNGRYQASSERSETEMDVPSEAIKKFHCEAFRRAERSLYEQSVLEREFLNMTLAFPKSEMKEAKEFIRNFHAQFAERFYTETKKNKNSVYNLSIQFFRVDESKEIQK